MHNFFKIKPQNKKYLRPVAGVVILLLGIIFMVVPFIPLGYIFVFGGLFLLSTRIPLFQKWLDKAKRHDKKNKIDKVEESVNKAEEKISRKIIIPDDEVNES